MKRNRLAKVIALLLVASLMLGACGAKEAKPSAESNAPQASGEKPYWEMLDEVSDTSELPDWTGDTLEITVWDAGGTNAVIGDISDNDVVYKEIERVTGIKFNVEECFDNGGNSIDAKLPMVIASDDFPTIIMGCDIESKLAELYEHGYLANLTEYYNDGTLDQLQKYMPMDVMDTLIYNATRTSEGEYYLVPYFTGADTSANIYISTGYEPDSKLWDYEHYMTHGYFPMNASGSHTDLGLFVREDILQALYPDSYTEEELREIWIERGYFTEEEIFDIPLKSREDFVQFLYDIQELIATGDYVDDSGKPMEVMAGPYTESDNWYWMQTLPTLTDGIAANTNYYVLADYNAENESDLLQYAYKTDYYVDYMKMLNQLVVDDVISQDSMLDNAAVFEEKNMNSHYAVTYGAMFIPYYYGIEGYRPVWVDAPYNTQEIGGFSQLEHNFYFGVFKDNLSDDQLDQLMHAINYMYSYVGSMNFYWGPKTAGLFEEDANGVRTFVDEDLKNAVLFGEQNGVDFNYGIIGSYMEQEPVFQLCPGGPAKHFCAPAYMFPETGKAEGVGREVDSVITMYIKYNPGAIAGKSLADNAINVTSSCDVYGSLGLEIDGIKTFWDARNGFENQMKKVIVAETEEDFEKQYNELLLYAEENGLTDETLQEFNDVFVEFNRDMLVDAGILD